MASTLYIHFGWTGIVVTGGGLALLALAGLLVTSRRQARP
jgi:MYXO-CTERM domain-containing protein